MLRLQDKGLYLRDLLMFELAKSPDPVFNDWLMHAITAIFRGNKPPKVQFGKGVNNMPITISVEVDSHEKGKQVVDTLFAALGKTAKASASDDDGETEEKQ